MKKTIANMLNNISKIQNTYAKEYAQSGIKFNLFSITKIEKKEVNTHSTIIAELLNPKGTHYQGDLFLKLFFNSISYLKNISLDFSTASVKKEKSFNKGKDRVDIFIEFDNFILIIENKIDASDQNKQIERYNEIGKKSKKEYIIIYLTKYGNEATKKSYQNDKVQYELLSYKNDITKWIDLCIKEVALIPQIREVLVQYNNLVKKITGVSLTMNENREIIEILKKDMISAKTICDNFEKAQIEKIYDFFSEILKEFNNKLIKKNDLSEEAQSCLLLNAKNQIDKKIIENWFNKDGKKEDKNKKASWELKLLLFNTKDNDNFCIMLATDYFYYGFVHLIEEKNNKLNFLRDEKKYEKEIKGYVFSKWEKSNFMWYAKKIHNFRKMDKDTLKFICNPKIFINKIESIIN